MKKILFLLLIVSIAASGIFLSCQKEISCEDCKANKLPIAIAGPDRIITVPTDSILLDGSGSDDPDGKIDEWLWKKIEGPYSFNIVSTSTSKTIIRKLVPGIYHFELKVTDDKGLSAKDTVMITVDAIPTAKHPPIANAGRDTIITLPINSITLDASASVDPDNNIVSFQWTKIAGPSSYLIANADALQSQATGLIEGIYRFELKVTDADGLFSKDTVQVTVNGINNSTINHPPVAGAGIDQTVILPTNAANLDASTSNDVDNNITGYSWAKISGPSSFTIVNSNSVQTQVTNLVEGVYQFELKVTDAGGLSSKDTVQITVSAPLLPVACDNSNRPQVSAQLIPVGTLSQARGGMAVASAGNKIVFAGGGAAGGPSSRVDIYDISMNTWSTSDLCVKRYLIASVASGNKVFFGGGEYGDGTWPVDSVDIYDVSTNTWTVSHLSTAGNGIAAAAVGNKVLFAGGDPGFNGTPGTDRSKQVDIYDMNTDTWATAQMSEKKEWLSAVTVNNKVYFAGGYSVEPDPNDPGHYRWYASNRVDVYDNTTNTWRTMTMYEGKGGPGGIAVNNKIFWSGGTTGTTPNTYNSCLVEIRDVNSGSSTIQYLSKPGGGLPVIQNNKILFLRAGSNEFDIYNTTTDTWFIGVLSQPIPVGAAIICVNNTVYIAGGNVSGSLSNQVYKLGF